MDKSLTAPHLSKTTVLCDSCDVNISFPPRLHGSIHINTPPSHDDETWLSHELAQARRALIPYDLTIKRMLDVLTELGPERAMQRTYVNEIARLLTPISRIPAEVLLEIMKICALHVDPYTVINLAPLRLGLVCRRWRNIALSSKPLWAFIKANLDNERYIRPISPSRIDVIPVAIVDIYLTRSNPLPLSVSVKAEEMYWPNHPLLRSLARNSHRWKVADLRVMPSYFGPGEVLEAISNNLPLLERLTFSTGVTRWRWHSQNLLGETTPMAQHFAVCPKLYYFKSPSGPATAKIPWTHIASLYGKKVPPSYLLMKIRKCPQLDRLAISQCEVDSRLDTSVESPLEANIRTLLIKRPICTHQSGLKALLDNLTFPRLESVTVSGGPILENLNDNTEWPDTGITSLLQRSNCPLQSITLDRIPISDTDLVDLLRLVPTLTSLDIIERCQYITDTWTITDSFLRLLTHSPKIDAGAVVLPDVVPRLTRIRLMASPHFTSSSLEEMVESRWNPTDVHSAGSGGLACLEVIEVGYTDQLLKPGSLDCLTRMRTQGLKVILHEEVY